MHVTTTGIDLAKSVLQFHGVDGDGHAVLRRGKVLAFLRHLPPC